MSKCLKIINLYIWHCIIIMIQICVNWWGDSITSHDFLYYGIKIDHQLNLKRFCSYSCFTLERNNSFTRLTQSTFNFLCKFMRIWLQLESKVDSKMRQKVFKSIWIQKVVEIIQILIFEFFRLFAKRYVWNTCFGYWESNKLIEN